MASPYEIEGHSIRSGVSIGIAIAPSDGKNADELLMAADLALYAVKNGGRGTYRFFKHSMNEEINDRREIELDLREALEKNQLHLEYQPIIDLRRNVVSGFEALARWEHPVKGSIPPAVFIPIAEDSGLILPLGEWALREACTQAARWPDNLKIAVNLSPVQFTRPISPISSCASSTKRRSRRTGWSSKSPNACSSPTPRTRCRHCIGSRPRRAHRDGRFRHRLFLAELSAQLSVRQDQDRPRLRFGSVGANSEHSVIVQAVIIIARALGMTHDRRRRRDRRSAELLESARLRRSAGLSVQPPVPVASLADFFAGWVPAKSLAA